MSIAEQAAIIGLGLIGGSLARDLSARGVRVSAYDADAVQLDAAVREGVVQQALDESASGVSTADLIVIAVPVDAAIGVLHRVARHAASSALITDVGSTKSSIVCAATAAGIGAQFVGSHPMAGDHRSGWEASRTGLFADARVYMCAGHDTARSAADRTAALWRALGAHPTATTAEDHDRTMAWASHLPHVASVALALAMSRAGVSRRDLGPGGRDATRLAGSSPDLWTAIVRDNAVALEAALAGLQDEIAAFRDALAVPDAAELRRGFGSARAWFDV